MASSAKARKSANLTPFAHAELDALVHRLRTEQHVKTTSQDLLGALVLTASRAPTSLVAALLPAYVAREEAELGGEP